MSQNYKRTFKSTKKSGLKVLLQLEDGKGVHHFTKRLRIFFRTVT